jgi:long-chain acyl-CoA synthetase
MTTATETVSAQPGSAEDNDRLFASRFWVKSYRPGVPATIDDQLAKSPSMAAMFEHDARRFADRKGFVSIGTEVTYGDMLEKAKTFAAWLQSVGVNKGDRVAIMMPNCLQYPAALFGTLMAGAVVVNVNPLYTARELNHQLKDSGTVAIVVMNMFARTLQEALPGTAVKNIVVTAMGDMLGGLKGIMISAVMKYAQKMVPPYKLPQAITWKKMMSRAKSLRFTPVETGHEDLAFLQYTGGTTGVAKGAMLTHRNVIANVLQGRAWSGDQMERLATHATLTSVTLLPLYHVFALTANLLIFTGFGGRNILIANPRDAKRVQMILKNENFDGFCGLNTLFANFLENEDFRKRDFSNLKFVIAGGMATQPEIAARWEKVTGKPIIEGYGLTECSPVVTSGYIDLEKPQDMRFTGRVGYPVPSTEVRMRKADGSWAAIGEPGELCVRGPQVMRGYWQRPEETANVLDKDGWLATGDIAVMHDTGEVEIVDRLKDMILVSGFNVYPSEIENVAISHPGVLEVAAIGVPDAVQGELVKLIVVPRDSSLTKEDLIAHCRKSLTGYKIPKIVEFREEELPKTNVGKVLRRELR